MKILTSEERAQNLNHNTVLFVVHHMQYTPLPLSQLRYSRSPSPVADLGYESQYTSSRSSLPTRPKGLTTMTSMIISNLSDTVSKNDVSVSFKPKMVFLPTPHLCSYDFLQFHSCVTCSIVGFSLVPEPFSSSSLGLKTRLTGFIQFTKSFTAIWYSNTIKC